MAAFVASIFMQIFKNRSIFSLFFWTVKIWKDSIKKGTFALTKEIATYIYLKVPYFENLKKENPTLFTLYLTPCSFFILHLILCPLYAFIKKPDTIDRSTFTHLTLFIYFLYGDLFSNYFKGFIFNVAKKTFGTFFNNVVNADLKDRIIRIPFYVLFALCYVPLSGMLSYPTAIFYWHQSLTHCWMFSLNQAVKHIPSIIVLELLKLQLGL